ncbi:PHB depolymerase family esterase [Oxalobacteraceae sp. CFBP 8753]|nr:PHB depolymerase family esterase [Oxalobacteraceae sp. CFBP 8753]
MKSLDQFMNKMMTSARLVQNKDVASATATIQQALAQAGLMPGQGHGQGQSTAPASKDATAFVDINPAPDWQAQLRKGQAAMRAAGVGVGIAMPQDDDVAVMDDVAGGTFTAGVFSNAAGRRRYKLYIPSQPSTAPRPLIVMLHGCTQNPDDFALGTGMNRLAEEANCLVLYPEQDSASNRTQCWNWFESGHQGRDAGEPGIIAGLTRQIVKEHGADPAQVFVAGMSAGGAMAAVLGAEYPDLFAAVGVHSGLPAGSGRDMITGLQAMKKPAKGRTLREAVPVIVFHGSTDHVVTPANGDAVLQQYVGAHAGLHATPLSVRHDDAAHGGRRCRRSVWRDDAGRAMAEQWVVQGAGHAWAGGNAAGSHTDAAGPSASKEMLRFFLGAKR